MITIILSVALVELLLICIIINKYRNAQKRYLSWKDDYFALKSVLDKELNRERNNADKLPFDKGWIDRPASWAKVTI